MFSSFSSSFSFSFPDVWFVVVVGIVVTVVVLAQVCGVLPFRWIAFDEGVQFGEV